MREGNRACSQWLSLGSSQVAGLVGVPLCLAVVAEARLAALPLTADSRAGGAAGSDNSKSAIGSRTPSCVWVLGKNPSHHQRLVKQQEAVVLAAEQGDVVGVHSLCALRTLEVDPAFLDFDPNILLKAIQTELMATVPQLDKLVRSLLAITKRTLLDRPLTPGQGNGSSSSNHTGAWTLSIHSHPI